jgi:hypothetical protein
MSGHLTIEERIYLVKKYYLNEKSDIHLRIKWPNDHSNSKPPIDKTIRYLIEKFEKTGSVLDDNVGNTGQPFTAITTENVENVSQIIEKTPKSPPEKVFWYR